MKEELLLSDKDITNFVEYEKDKFVVSIYKDASYLALVDRNNKDSIISIEHPLGGIYKTIQLQ